MKKFIHKAIESVIYTTGTLSTLIVLFIIYFLFKEGSGIFQKAPIEEGYSIVVNRFNLVDSLSATDIKKIFEGEYRNWKELGGHYDSIYTFTLSDLEYKFTAEELGENFEHINEKVAEYVETNTGVIAVMPNKYLDSTLTKVAVGSINISEMLKGEEWYPAATPSPLFGTLPIILGSFLVSILAMLIAVPVGMIVAIYLAEVAEARVRNICKTIIELLAGIPSVVMGFFGLVLVVPMVKDTFHLSAGETAFTGSIILSIIALPTIISLSEDAIRAAPTDLKNASMALGANQWQTIRGVILPFAGSGIISAAILGTGRAFGETMAVLMVTGNAAIMPTSVFDPVRTITATIAAELGEAPSGGMHYEALFILGAILFVFTFIFNLVAELFAIKK